MDKVTFKFEADTSALLLDLQAGSIDCTSVDSTTASQVDKSMYNFYEVHSNAVQQLDLNNKFKPFSDVRVRKAISYALDKKQIIDTVNSGKGTQVGTPVIPGLKKYYNESLSNEYDLNIEKAKQLLKEAGYANGLSFVITVPSNYKVHVDTAQVIVSQLEKIGVDAKIKQVDWATWLSDVYTNRDYEATVISVDSSVLTPAGFLDRYRSDASNNFINYNNKNFDKILSEAINETDDSKRTEMYLNLQKILSDDAASVYIQDISDITVMKKEFSGFVSYPMYVFDASTIK